MPIGLLSSGILSNYALSDLDDAIESKINPAFYGRYVDDIILVVTNPKLNDKTKFNYNTFLVKKLGFKYSQGLLSWVNKKSNGAFYIQSDKIQFQYLSSKGSRSIIRNFRNKINKNRSEFRFLPDEEILNSFFDEEAYVLTYKDSFQKLRSIDKIEEDKFKISKFLSSKIFSALYSERKKCDISTNQILTFFHGAINIKFYSLWEKVILYFFVNNQFHEIYLFIDEVLKAIAGLQMNKDYKDAKKNIQSSLTSVLYSAIYRVFALGISDYNNKRYSKNIADIKSKINHTRYEGLVTFDQMCLFYRKSLLFRQDLVSVPLIYLVKGLSDIIDSYIDFELEDLSKKNVNYEIDPKIKELMPRFIHDYEKSILDMFSQYFRNDPSIEGIEGLCSDEKIRSFGVIYEKDISSPKDINASIISTKLLMLKHKTFANTEFCEERETLGEHIYIEDIASNNKTDVKVAIVNIKLPESNIKSSILGPCNLSKDRRAILFKLFNQAIEEKVDLIVFPELAIPFQWLPLLLNQAAKKNIGIITGLEYAITNNTAYNFLVTILPYEDKYSKSCLFKARLKNYYSPEEIEVLRGYRLNMPVTNQVKYNIFHWRNMSFVCYNCFELARIEDRALFKSQVDFITASTYNKDTNYFSDIIGSWSRDLHCYIIQANTSHYGDSRIISPRKSVEKNIVQIKGGENSTILTAKLHLEDLRDFQMMGYNLQMKDKRFKPTPPGFNRHYVKQRMKKTRDRMIELKKI